MEVDIIEVPIVSCNKCEGEGTIDTIHQVGHMLPSINKVQCPLCKGKKKIAIIPDTYTPVPKFTTSKSKILL